MVYHPKRLPRNSLELIYKRAEGDTSAQGDLAGRLVRQLKLAEDSR